MNKLFMVAVMETWRFANRDAEWWLLMALKETADRVGAEEKRGGKAPPQEPALQRIWRIKTGFYHVDGSMISVGDR